MARPYDYYTIQTFEQDHCFEGIYPVNDCDFQLRGIAAEMARYFQRECHYDFPPFDESVKDRNVAVYLLGCGGCWVGACGFRKGVDVSNCGVKDGTAWLLEWIWIHPYCRGRDELGKMWTQLESSHGEFLILAPLSPAMKAFLHNRGVAEKRIVWAGRAG